MSKKEVSSLLGVLAFITCEVFLIRGYWNFFGPETFWQRLWCALFGIPFSLFALLPSLFLAMMVRGFLHTNTPPQPPVKQVTIIDGSTRQVTVIDAPRAKVK